MAGGKNFSLDLKNKVTSRTSWRSSWSKTMQAIKYFDINDHPIGTITTTTCDDDAFFCLLIYQIVPLALVAKPFWLLVSKGFYV